MNKKIGLVGAFFFLLLPVWIAGQAPGTHEGQPAVVLSNGKLELTVMKQGATLANLVLADDPEKLSPLWNPIRMARELGTTPLPASVGGHFVCVDGFGPVSRRSGPQGFPTTGRHISPTSKPAPNAMAPRFPSRSASASPSSRKYLPGTSAWWTGKTSYM